MQSNIIIVAAQLYNLMHCLLHMLACSIYIYTIIPNMAVHVLKLNLMHRLLHVLACSIYTIIPNMVVHVLKLELRAL